MTDRPTREQVDDALFGEREHREELADWDVDAAQSFQVLAAEVRALREELAEARLFASSCEDQHYKLARIEALAKDYEAQSKAELDSLLILRLTHGDAAMDIRAALRGEP